MSRVKLMVAVMITGLLFLALTIPGIAAESEYTKQRKEINLYGAFGLASFFFEEGLLDLGLEFQVTRGFFLSIEVNNRLGGGRRYWDPYYYGYGYATGYGWYSPGIGIYANSMYAANLFGTIKLRISRTGKTRLFTKGGIFFLFSSGLDDSGYDYSPSNDTESGLGGAIGTGIEYRIASRVTLVSGFTYKTLFKQKLYELDTQKTGDHWFKYYLGIAYRLR